MENILSYTFLVTLFAAAVRLAVPVIYAGLGEVIAEKTGILNIGMEGVMLCGAFFSFVGALWSGSLFTGLLFGIAGGILISMLHAFLSIRLAKDQSVSGLALNVFSLGLTSFFFKLVTQGMSYQQLPTLQQISIPVLSDIPLIGKGIFSQDILTYLLYVLVILTIFVYHKTNTGLSSRSIGENPHAAASAGINVHRYQYIAMLINGILGGIGGSYLVLSQLGVFTENMTSGRGYIALAAVILGRYTPVGMVVAALLFGLANALQIRLQTIGISVSPYLLAILPYAITLAAMLGTAGKNRKPASLAVPYIRGSR